MEKVIMATWFEKRLKSLSEISSACRVEIDRSTGVLESELRSPSKFRIGVFSVALNSIACCLGSIALPRIHIGDPTGWSVLAKSLEYALASFKVRYAAEFPAKCWQDTNRLCHLLCTSYVLKSDSLFEWLRSEVNTGPGGPYLDWNEPFERLTLAICQKTSSLPISFAEEINASVYGKLWNADRTGFPNQVVDFNESRGILTNPNKLDYPPFEFPPFDLFAVDVLAIAELKDVRLGELTQLPELFRSPINSPPLPFRFEGASIIERVLEQAPTKRSVPAVSWSN